MKNSTFSSLLLTEIKLISIVEIAGKSANILTIVYKTEVFIKMDSFIFAINAVLPIVLMVAAGYAIKRFGIIDSSVAKSVNKIVFRLLLPCMLFLNVYSITDISSIDASYIIFGVVASLAVFLAAFVTSGFVEKERGRRGVIVQAAFRSNYALIGIPLATSLFGNEGSIIATVLSAFSIPLFNVLAVICLTVFGSTGKPDIKKILLGIVKNPLILSIFLGFVCLGIRGIFAHYEIAFRLSDVTPVYSAINQLSKASTPIALLALGAQFEFSAVAELKKQIIFGTAVRTVIVPALALAAAYFMGCFNGAHFAAFVALFASPVAVSTVPMTQEMNGDTTLAGQLVVWTTVVSSFTVFLFSFLLKSAGIF